MRLVVSMVVGMPFVLASHAVAARQAFAVGSDSGLTANARLYDIGNTATPLLNLAPYGTFTGGVRVAVGDVNGDGKADLVVGVGPGASPLVSIYNGRTGTLIDQYYAFSTTFSGGVYVAAGDVDGDGHADVIIGVDAGASPSVKVISGRNRSVLRNFQAYAPGYTGGVRVAAGDVNGDGHADIITATGPGTATEVRVFDGVSGTMIGDFMPFGTTYTGGAYVAAADLDGDGRADIVVGADAGSSPTVRVFSGATYSMLSNLVAYSPSFSGGVRVGAGDVDGDGRSEIIVAAGGGADEVKVLTWPALGTAADFLPYGAGDVHGAFVAGPAPADVIFANGMESD